MAKLHLAQKILDIMYPVGSIYISDTFYTNPSFLAYPSGAEFYPDSGGVR